jgi:hypothetical protein
LGGEGPGECYMVTRSSDAMWKCGLDLISKSEVLRKSGIMVSFWCLYERHVCVLLVRHMANGAVMYLR